MKRSALPPLLIAAAVFFQGCGLKKDDDKKNKQKSIIGYWLMDVMEMGGGQLSRPVSSDSILLAIDSSELQIYALNGRNESFVGIKQSYRLASQKIEIAKGDGESEDVSAVIESTSNDRMKVRDAVTGKGELIFRRAEFRRISYDESLSLYNDVYLVGRIEKLKPEQGTNTEKEEEEKEEIEDFASSRDLDGFWLFSGVSVDDKVIGRGKLIASQKVIVPDEDVLFHFDQGKMIQYHRTGATSEVYFSFSILGDEIIAKEQTIDGKRYGEARIKVQIFNKSAGMLEIEQTSTYGFKATGEWYNRISQEKAEEILHENFVYQKYFPRESSEP